MRDYMTQEATCRKCGGWFHVDELNWGYCSQCLEKIQAHIEGQVRKKLKN